MIVQLTILPQEPVGALDTGHWKYEELQYEGTSTLELGGVDLVPDDQWECHLRRTDATKAPARIITPKRMHNYSV